MESLEEQYGYDDEIFVSETPDYLRCIICSLVLRDPVQILSCGHKFCTVCFTRLQARTKATNAELSCPIDREIVPLTEVRDDVAMRRAIGNLTVRCRESESGCTWTGDLRDSERHANGCLFRQRVPPEIEGTTDIGGLEVMMREMQGRLLRCENVLVEKDHEIAKKDKEIATLMHDVQQLRDQCEQKDKQVTGLFDRMEELSSKVDAKNKETTGSKEKVRLMLNEEAESAALKGIMKEVGILKLKSLEFEGSIELLSKKVDQLGRKTTTHGNDHNALSEKVEALEKKSSTDARVDALSKKLESMETSALGERVDALSKNVENMKAEAQVESSKNAAGSSSSTTDIKAVVGKPNKGATEAIVSKPVSTKIVNLQRHRGERNDTGFQMPGNHRVHFVDFATVSAPNVLVKKGMKVFYEVQFIEVASGGDSRVGWASKNLSRMNVMVRKGVGDVANSYGFNPQQAQHKGGSVATWTKWGKVMEKQGKQYLGVAIDMKQGTVAYGVNGEWCAPLGIAFFKIDMDVDYFPAISGEEVKIIVNFGDRPFIHGPPNNSFQPLNSIA